MEVKEIRNIIILSWYDCPRHDIYVRVYPKGRSVKFRRMVA